MKSESAKPLIGIVVCGLSDNRQFVSNPYIQSVRYSGGIPILLPLIRSDSMLEQYLRLCDGFLFCGGNDITPLLFGQEPREGIRDTNITLDLFQIRLMKLILSSAKPVFSICRGMQIFNTACQGTIFQDIRYQPGEVCSVSAAAICSASDITCWINGSLSSFSGSATCPLTIPLSSRASRMADRKSVV